MRRIYAAVFQSPPRHPQRDTLLRIHRDGLTRRNPEESGSNVVAPGGIRQVMDLFETVAT